MVKKFNDFLNEQYQDLSETRWNDIYDKAFGNYALNEQPFIFNIDDKTNAKAYYGGVDVGIVYSGGRINSLEKYNELKELKKVIHLNMTSATPDFGTAQSFAFFVKSYDEMTTHHMMQNAIKNGSSGKFGSFVMTLKPKSDQVIYTTFKDTARELTRTAEKECILDGDIEVIDIVIYDRLTMDNYKDIIINLTLDELFNSFFRTWFNENKLCDDNDLITKLISKHIKSHDDAKRFIEKICNGGFILNLNVDHLLKNIHLKTIIERYITFDDGEFTFFGTIPIDNIKGLDGYLFNVKNDLLMGYVNDHRHDGNIIKLYGYPVLDSDANKLISIIKQFRKNNVNFDLGIISKSEDIFFDIINILDTPLTDISNDELKKCLNQIEHFKYNFDAVIPMFSSKFKKSLINIYQNFGSGYMDNSDNFKSKIHYQRKIVTEILSLLMKNN